MAGGELLAMVAAHLVLTGLPGVAAALVLARRGTQSVPLLLAAALAAAGLVAILSFWLYYADPVVGESFSYLVVLGSIGLSAWSIRGGNLDPALLRRLATPLSLWGLGSVFVLFLGFLHGGTEEPLRTALTRFSGQLPADNAIPGFYGEWFFDNGHRGTPPIFPGEWLSSDRPPLQVGYLLSQRPLGFGDAELSYQVLGVILQQLWIVGLWALLLAARLGRVTRALAMVTVLASDIAIVHGFFVWPKLLPAAMLLAAAALVVTPLWAEVRRSLWGAALLATLLALAMLGHGSSVFGAVPLLLIAAWRGLPSWRWVGVAALACLLLVLPWSAYQRYGDPPGNRVVKWQLAGVVDVDDRGVGETLLDSYGDAGIGGAIHNKGQNFVTIAGGGPMAEHLDAAATAIGDGDLARFAEEVRNVFFFNLLPAFGLLLIVPLLMLAARRRGRDHPAEWAFALTCLAAVAIGAVAWALLLFGNSASRAIVHQGSYLLPILGFCGAVAGLRACFPRFAVWFVSVAALLMLALYVPALTPPPDTSYSPAAALLAVAGLLGFGAVAFLPVSRED